MRRPGTTVSHRPFSYFDILFLPWRNEHDFHKKRLPLSFECLAPVRGLFLSFRFQIYQSREERINNPRSRSSMTIRQPHSNLEQVSGITFSTTLQDTLMKEMMLKPKGSLFMGEVANLVAVQRNGGRPLP
jgi:hypothetical protein